MNGAAHVEPVGFEVGCGVEEGVGGPVEVFELMLAGGEAGEGVFEVGLVVGLEEEFAAVVAEDAVEAVEEFALVDEAAGGVAFLGPGVGAEEMEAGDAGGGEEPADGVGAFEAHDAGVGKLLGVDLAPGFDDAAKHALDAEEVALGMVGGHAGEEGAVATAEIDFEGAGGVGEDFSAGEFAEVIGGREEGGHGGWCADECGGWQARNCGGGEESLRWLAVVSKGASGAANEWGNGRNGELQRQDLRRGIQNGGA